MHGVTWPAMACACMHCWQRDAHLAGLWLCSMAWWSIAFEKLAVGRQLCARCTWGTRVRPHPMHPMHPMPLPRAQAYFEKGPERVHNLRPDSLAMMLSLAHVAAGAKVSTAPDVHVVPASCLRSMHLLSYQPLSHP